MTLKKIFVPFEIAKMAKDKGFKENCLGFYAKGILHIGEGVNSEGYILSDPLYQQLLTWLYEEHGIVITITDYQNTDTPNTGLRYTISVYGSIEIAISKDFTDMTELLNTALIEAFKLI